MVAMVVTLSPTNVYLMSLRWMAVSYMYQNLYCLGLGGREGEGLQNECVWNTVLEWEH